MCQNLSGMTYLQFFGNNVFYKRKVFQKQLQLSWSNFNFRAPDAYLAPSYLTATVLKLHQSMDYDRIRNVLTFITIYLVFVVFYLFTKFQQYYISTIYWPYLKSAVTQNLTLRSQIEGVPTNQFSGNYPSYPMLFEPKYPFINFQENFQPPCFLTYTNKKNSTLTAVITAYLIFKFEENFNLPFY